MQALEPVDVQLARCEEQQDVLRKLARIHIDIDAPKRIIALTSRIGYSAFARCASMR